MAIDYVPSFQHSDWIDNVDRVQAGGDNGFNARFNALQFEFQKVAGVVKKISEAIDALHAPAPTAVKLTLTPTLVTLGNDPWEHVLGGVSKPLGASAASGMMSVSFPHGVTLRELRICGRKDAGILEVGLRRQSLAAGSVTELLVALTASNGSFDLPKVVPGGSAAKVDNDQFRYYLTAEVDNAAGAVVQLTCFQLTYIAA